MSVETIIELLNEACLKGTHPSDLHSLNKFLKAVARYSLCVEEQARHDESLDYAEKFEDSRSYLTQAFDWALVGTYKDNRG